MYCDLLKNMHCAARTERPKEIGVHPKQLESSTDIPILAKGNCAKRRCV
jgi:hypothetical protein